MSSDHIQPATIDGARRAAAAETQSFGRAELASGCDDPEVLAYWHDRNRYYYGEIARLFRLHVPEGASILHVGCGLGDLLAALRPRIGLGIESREHIVAAARARWEDSHLRFEAQPLESLETDQTFDYVLIDSALANLHDIQAMLQRVRLACRPETRIVLCYYSALWGPLLRFASRIRLRRHTGEQNWLSAYDFDNLLRLSGFEIITRSRETLLPKRIPGLNFLFNRILAKVWPFTHLCLTQLFVARAVLPPENAHDMSCTVVIPTRNERGNIESAVRRLPEIGRHTEVIFVDGNSTDGTAQEIERVINAVDFIRSQSCEKSEPRLPKDEPRQDRFSFKLIHQGDGRGKGDAVRKGFAAATGDVLMILDADLTVPPEDLPRFFTPIVDGTAEFINGTRLVYPMEQQAMRLLNKLGNHFFSRLFTWLLGQRFRDTLCGTKALSRRNYDVIAANRHYFGEFDPFGDFDLIFGAAKANLKIIEVPVRYRARTYGETNIHRFRHGWLLLKMSWVAFKRLKMR